MKKTLLLCFFILTGIFINTVSIQAHTNDVALEKKLTGESEINNLVVFVRFNDEQDYNSPLSLSEYDDLFNSEEGPSLKHYYQSVSNNQLTINSHFISENDEIKYYTDSMPRSYFLQYNASTNPGGYQTSSEKRELEHKLIERIITWLDAFNLVDESIDFDTNDDGVLDSITFMMSGEDDGWLSILWPHKWSLYKGYIKWSDTFRDDAPTVNGLNIYNYNVNLLGYSKDYEFTDSVGVLAHEMFHMIGGPDLYSYDGYSYLRNTGYWDLMDKHDKLPTHMLGYMKEYYGGWLDEVREITENGIYTLEPIEHNSNNLYKINTNYSNEYLYLEYRTNDDLYSVSEYNQSGLILYRVDLDNQDEGNIRGYDGEEESLNELFVFRPLIQDISAPIELPKDVYTTIPYGKIEHAALSNNNLYNHAGLNNEFLLFHSDGSLMDITILNVKEENGSISFHVIIDEISINLSTDVDLSSQDDIVLLNSPLMDYQFEVQNGEHFTIRYTIDGSTPTKDSKLYTEATSFDSLTNHITIGLFDGDDLIYDVSKEFTFVDEVNLHSEQTYFLSPEEYIQPFEASFSKDNLTEGHAISFITMTDETTLTSDLNSQEIIIEEDTFIHYDNLDTTEELSIFLSTSTETPFTINGESSIVLDVFDQYIEENGTFDPNLSDAYTLLIENTVNTNITGSYIVYYHIYNELNEKIDTFYRKVTVSDTTPPDISLNGEEVVILRLGEAFTDEGVTVTDNYSENIRTSMIGQIQSHTVGEYQITYIAYDEAGNSATISRTLKVIDDIAPTATLNPGVDTITVGEEYIDQGVTAKDNYYQRFDIQTSSNIDTSTPGTYEIIYTVKDGSDNQVIIKRMVTVLEKQEPITFTFGEGYISYFKNQELDLPTCHVNDMTCDVDISSIDTSTTGIKTVIYSITIDDITYTKEVSIYVYGRTPNEVLHYEKKRGIFL